jgi:sec-independent protein translocase protein TatA
MTPGIWQILLIVLIVFLIFGAGKLPSVMGDLAKGVRNFKKGLNDDDADAPKAHIDQKKSTESVDQKESSKAEK